jgi:metal-responsive CopG/Arc/MetJ family transcriptional regulator
MLEPSVKLRKELWEKVKRVAASAGYHSPREFVEHVLEREVAKLEDTQSDEEIARKLKGLGYLD